MSNPPMPNKKDNDIRIEELMNLFVNNRVWWEFASEAKDRLLDLTGQPKNELQAEINMRRREKIKKASK